MKSIDSSKSKLVICAKGAALIWCVWPAFAQAQPTERWPVKAVRLVVTFPPGGSSDLIARLVGPKLTTAFGQTFIVENRPGAAGILGSEFVAKAAPDGYTLLVSTVGSHGIAPTLNRNIRYDAVKDFTHISMFSVIPHVLVVHPSLPVKTVKDFVTLAKSRPGKLDFGSGGTGSINHIAGELFKSKSGIDIVHVPYKGSAAAIIDVLGGAIPSAFDALPANLGYIRAGKLRALAITSKERSAVEPSIPTFVEQGYPAMAVDNWVGFSAPAKLPPEVAARLAQEIKKVLDMPDVRERLMEWGMAPAFRAPVEFTGFVRTDIERWRPVIIASGAQID